MAEDDNKTPVRTFTEQEAYALVADNVKRETAEREATIETLTSEKAALETKLELSEVALAAEKARADGAIEWHEAVLAAAETEKAQLARKDERIAKVKEVAPQLKDEFFTNERAAKWCALDQEAFEAYTKELAELSTGAPAATAEGTPRETAMTGTPVAGAPAGGTLLGQLLGGPKKTGV